MEGRSNSSRTLNMDTGSALHSHRTTSTLLSSGERNRIIARAFHGLYRRFLSGSQTSRNWNPDSSFAWKDLRRDHSPALISIVEGFYAVEQYSPDYTAQLASLVRYEYGRSQYYLRWGTEEQRHADLWRNVLLFSGARTEDLLDQYTADLRTHQWQLPWNDPLRMLMYTLFQERATELIYLNTARIARGHTRKDWLANDKDPVLARIATSIAIDEAAHYEFFLEGARLFLHYYPEETVTALVDVLRHFVMPASDLIYNYDGFINDLYAADIFGKRKYVRDVVHIVLKNLGVRCFRKLEETILHHGHGSVAHGYGELASALACVDTSFVEQTITRLFARLDRYEQEVGSTNATASPCTANPQE